MRAMVPATAVHSRVSACSCGTAAVPSLGGYAGTLDVTLGFDTLFSQCQNVVKSIKFCNNNQK
jgi:hypothetical protein